jgi:hypothetical protein
MTGPTFFQMDIRLQNCQQAPAVYTVVLETDTGFAGMVGWLGNCHLQLAAIEKKRLFHE